MVRKSSCQRLNRMLKKCWTARDTTNQGSRTNRASKTRRPVSKQPWRHVGNLQTLCPQVRRWAVSWPSSGVWVLDLRAKVQQLGSQLGQIWPTFKNISFLSDLWCSQIPRVEASHPHHPVLTIPFEVPWLLGMNSVASTRKVLHKHRLIEGVCAL